ncbi:di-heme oxidoredictase family protein [Marinifaba aquimaris]|uniref:di-heme oxidoredictase family protein n=1 Tax=Marinifaba aquimaris TaxID=2741323 RepID=UPI001572F5D2|nr:di-heme oxidoredictase family protein [Marinifaba aquimaris]
MHFSAFVRYSSLLACGVVTLIACDSLRVESASDAEFSPGGDLSAPPAWKQVKLESGGVLDDSQLQNFELGKAAFQKTWPTDDKSPLGPLYNANSCNACHFQTRRGKEAEEGVTRPTALVIQLGPNDHFADDYDIKYGSQIQTHSTDETKHPIESEVLLEYKVINGRYDDGQKFELRDPQFRLLNFNYGPLNQETGISPRLAPNLTGLGLIDAIKDSDLLDLEDVDDNDGDGISGKYNWVTDIETGKLDIGKFGYKAEHPSLKQHIAAEYAANMGLTNPIYRQLDCTGREHACQPNPEMSSISVTSSSKLEVDEANLEQITAFLSFLTVPETRLLNKPSTLRGRKLFRQVGCDKCHTPSFTTDENYPIKALAGQTIWPYSDFALHDMGDGLADHTHENYANGREWRTPPLWAIGIERSTESRFLHDGRARTIEEAIMWHGGEAEASRKAFADLSRSDRIAIIDFIMSI